MRLESLPMLTAPAIEATEPATIAEPPDLHIVPSPSGSRGHRNPVAVSNVTVPAEPTARIHWIGRFVHYRHPEDLYADLLAEMPNLVIVDARYRETFVLEHLPGAINLPWREIDERTTAHLPRDAEYVVYCWNASCGASAKTAERLESLGFRVKELHGGLQVWKTQGYPTVRS
ncbi:MAG: rhodanese-like domain-containing protein [Candidatus Limnocylindrales bacterium]